MKIVLSDCQVDCLRVVKRWNLGVEGFSPGLGPPSPTKLQIIGAIPRDLIEIELFGKHPRELIHHDLAELELLGLLKHAFCRRGPYSTIEFTTMDGAHAQIEVREVDETGKRRVFLRRPPLSHIRRMEEDTLGYGLEPHGVEALNDFEEALKLGKQIEKHHFFPEINTPLARFMDVADMAYQQDLSGMTYSDGRPAYTDKGPLKNWGDVQEAYERAKAFVLKLSNAQIVEKALDECFHALQASADAQHGGRATDQILSLAGKFITARNHLRGYVRVMPESQTTHTHLKDSTSPERRTAKAARKSQKKPKAKPAKTAKNAARPHGLKLSETLCKASWNNIPLPINTAADFKLLKCLMEREGDLVSYADLILAIKPGTVSGSVACKSSPVDVREAVSHVRRALRKVKAAVAINNIRSAGYQLQILHK